MSMEASGKIGPDLVFSKRKSGQMARYQRPPKDRETASQVLQRAVYTAGVSAWNALTEEQKSEWIESAVNLHMTGYNLYMRNYLDTHSAGEDVATYGIGIFGNTIFGNA